MSTEEHHGVGHIVPVRFLVATGVALLLPLTAAAQTVASLIGGSGWAGLGSGTNFTIDQDGQIAPDARVRRDLSIAHRPLG